MSRQLRARIWRGVLLLRRACLGNIHMAETSYTRIVTLHDVDGWSPCPLAITPTSSILGNRRLPIPPPHASTHHLLIYEWTTRPLILILYWLISISLLKLLLILDRTAIIWWVRQFYLYCYWRDVLGGFGHHWPVGWNRIFPISGRLFSLCWFSW